MQVELTGKRVLVTGASRGIGHALARHLHAAGAEVLIHFGRQQQAAAELAAALGERAHPVQMDLSKLDELSAWFTGLRERFGPIHSLVNNAGVAHAVAMEAEESQWLALWEHTFQVNVGAVAVLCKAFIQHAIADGHSGRIVNIASRAGFRGDTPEYLAYGASKGAVLSLTRSIARYYGKKEIMAFNVAPGFTRTDMAKDFIQRYGEDYALNDIALNKLTEPEDLAPIVTLLCSGLADHATGTSIDINAGSYVR